MKHFLSLIGSISEWSGKGIAFLVVPVALIVTYETVARYVFDAPTIWGFELTIFMCIAIYLLAGAYVHLVDEHVRVDIIYAKLAPRKKAFFNALITAPLLLIFCGVLLWEGIEWTWQALIGGLSSGTQWDPILFPVRLIIPLSAFLLILQGLTNFICDLNRAFRMKEE